MSKGNVRLKDTSDVKLQRICEIINRFTKTNYVLPNEHNNVATAVGKRFLYVLFTFWRKQMKILPNQEIQPDYDRIHS